MRRFKSMGLMVLVFCAGITWAEDIDAEILKDLDFYSEMEVVETEAMLDAVKAGKTEMTEKAKTASQEGDGQ